MLKIEKLFAPMLVSAPSAEKRTVGYIDITDEKPD